MFEAMVFFAGLSSAALVVIGVMFIAAFLFDLGSDSAFAGALMAFGLGLVGTTLCALLWAVPVLVEAVAHA